MTQTSKKPSITQNGRKSSSIIAAAALLLFACKEKPRDSSLKIPEQKGSKISASSPASVKSPAPAATVSAVSGPVELTLSLYKTKVKMGEPLWYKIQIRNVGKKRIDVVDKFFDDRWGISRNMNLQAGLYVVVRGPEGDVFPSNVSAADRIPYSSSPSEPPNPAELAWYRKRVSEWKKQGLSIDEINMKLLEVSPPTELPKVHVLAPLESISSIPSVAPNRAKKGQSDLEPIGDYSELWLYEFPMPGKYKLQAFFENSIGIVPGQDPSDSQSDLMAISLKTPEIAFEVFP